MTDATWASGFRARATPVLGRFFGRFLVEHVSFEELKCGLAVWRFHPSRNIPALRRQPGRAIAVGRLLCMGGDGWR